MCLLELRKSKYKVKRLIQVISYNCSHINKKTNLIVKMIKPHRIFTRTGGFPLTTLCLIVTDCRSVSHAAY